MLLAKGEGLIPRRATRIKGKVSARVDSAVSSEITLAIAKKEKTLTATITRGSAEAMGLKVGEPLTALIKAPHVILASRVARSGSGHA